MLFNTYQPKPTHYSSTPHLLYIHTQQTQLLPLPKTKNLNQFKIFHHLARFPIPKDHMGRQEEKHEDPGVVVHSSIALLQERFRQLQRVKEMREERELVRLLSLSDPKKLSLFNTCVLFDPAIARFFSHPELMLLPPTTPPQTSLSLWPTSQSQSPSQRKKHPDQNYYKAGVGVSVVVPPLMNLWPPADTTSTCDSATSLINKLDDDDDDDDEDSDTDIDTSLHL